MSILYICTSNRKLLCVSIGFLGGNIKDGTYFRIIFRILAGNVWYWNLPSILAFRNSEVNLSWFSPFCLVARIFIFCIKYALSGAVNSKLSTLISPIISSTDPPVKLAFSFKENSASGYLVVRFKSCGRTLLTTARKLKVGTLDVTFTSPFR